MELLIHPEDLLLRCRTIAQISTANPATKMAATHHGPTPVGMGRRMMITQIHHGQDIFLPGPSIFGLPSDSEIHLSLRTAQSAGSIAEPGTPPAAS
jgi:hypothetical protein